MFRATIRRSAVFAVLFTAIGAALTSARPAPTRPQTASAPTSSGGACALLTPADIAKATELTVGVGTAGAPIPGVLGRCTWAGSGDTKVIVTLADAQRMQMTVGAQQHAGAEEVTGVGSKAVGMKGAGFTGGGYILSVLDAKGGFGVSVLGKAGTKDGAIALAKVVETHR